MSDATILLLLGMLFLLGLLADLVGRSTFLPRVTMLLLGGIAVGPTGMGVVPDEFMAQWFPLLTHIALGMIGFLLGEKLRFSAIRKRGIAVLGLSIGKVGGAATLVFGAMLLCGADAPMALLLGGIATATAPAATYDVVKETGATSEFSETLLGVTAIDDAWGLLLFTLLMAAAGVMVDHGELNDELLAGVGEIGGSLLLGGAMGIPMAFLTGRVRKGEPSLSEALGMVLACTGGALFFEVSPILAAMAMGSTVASLARHHHRPFHAIEGIDWPFLILFFVLAGASLDVTHLAGLGWIGAAYVLARAVGTYVGTYIGGVVVGAPSVLNRWLGLALLPQAGVAIGMALIASQRFPDLAERILPIVLASTVLFELVAPVMTRRVIKRFGAADTAPVAKPR